MRARAGRLARTCDHPHILDVRVLVLPGMDGGAALSAGFRAALSLDHDVVAAEYPHDGAASYAGSEAHVRALLSGDPRPTVVVAESYSGPVAIRVAAEPPDWLRGVVLVATFARSPMPPVPGYLLDLLVRGSPPPAAIVRRLMIDRDGDSGPVRSAIARTPPAVMARRLRDVGRVDVRDHLMRRRTPALAVRASRDRLVPRSRFVSRDDPTLETVVIEGPHLLLHARPREAAAVIARWVVSW